MGMTADRKFDWIAGLSVAAGAAVMVPALAALAVSLAAVFVCLF
jgi:hypothetical protein